MSYDFNADDVLEIAEQLERNGGKFYRSAADSTSDPANKEFLLGLAVIYTVIIGTFVIPS